MQFPVQVSLVRKVQANSVGYDDVVSVVFLLTKNSKVTCVTASTQYCTCIMVSLHSLYVTIMSISYTH